MESLAIWHLHEQRLCSPGLAHGEVALSIVVLGLASASQSTGGADRTSKECTGGLCKRLLPTGLLEACKRDPGSCVGHTTPSTNNSSILGMLSVLARRVGVHTCSKKASTLSSCAKAGVPPASFMSAPITTAWSWATSSAARSQVNSAARSHRSNASSTVPEAQHSTAHSNAWVQHWSQVNSAARSHRIFNSTWDDTQHDTA